jgi:S-adenosylmethionine/arginine decarboxylase-like enzyme
MRPYIVRNVTSDGRDVISAMTMIAESHISIHVFPGERKAYLDVFSCRFFDREKMVAELKSFFPGEVVNDALVPRGTAYTTLRSEREPEHEKAKAWLSSLRHITG